MVLTFSATLEMLGDWPEKADDTPWSSEAPLARHQTESRVKYWATEDSEQWFGLIVKH